MDVYVVKTTDPFGPALVELVNGYITDLKCRGLAPASIDRGYRFVLERIFLPWCAGNVIAPIAQQLPVLTTEFGEKDCGSAFIDSYMNWADAHGVSYLAWVWNTWSCAPMGLLASYDGTPSAYGQPIHDHYLATNTVG